MTGCPRCRWRLAAGRFLVVVERRVGRVEWVRMVCPVCAAPVYRIVR